MNAYLLAALLLTTPAMAGSASAPDEFDHRWHMKDQSRMPQTPVDVERIYEANEYSPIDAMAKPLPVASSLNKADVCAKVGRRKVMIGQYRWRCR